MSMQANPDNLNQNTSGQGQTGQTSKQKNKRTALRVNVPPDLVRLCGMQLLGVAGHGCMHACRNALSIIIKSSII